MSEGEPVGLAVAYELQRLHRVVPFPDETAIVPAMRLDHGTGGVRPDTDDVLFEYE